MTEDEFRNALQQYLLKRRTDDILFTDIEIEGMDFAEYHIARLKRENNDTWNPSKADERVSQLKSLGLTEEHKCDHCTNVFQMHAGDNFCSACQQFTFIPAVETTQS